LLGQSFSVEKARFESPFQFDMSLKIRKILMSG
jgi:hypothetical protein